MKGITEQQLLWTKQLSRACAMGEEAHAAVSILRPGERVTLWTRTAPEAKPVYLRADPYAVYGIGRIIKSRMEDLHQEGLGDVAQAILEGPTRSAATQLRNVRDELQKLQDDARRDFEADQPPYELLGDGLEDLDEEYMQSEEFRRECHEDDDPQMPNEWDKGPDPIF